MDISSQEFMSFISQFIDALPASVYWKDLNGNYHGCNKYMLDIFDLPNQEAIKGKQDKDLPWSASANKLRQIDQEVIKNNQAIVLEEIASFKGKELVFLTSKVPFKDKDGNPIGIIGASFDITDRKQAEVKAQKAIEETTKLKIENATHKAELEAQAKFTQNAYSVAHDIRSPISSLLMIVRNCKEIPEDNRIALREIAISIGDIANNLLTKYGDKEKEGSIEERKPLLLSAILLHLISDKKHQYKALDHKFDHYFTQAGQLAFINIQQSQFKRMVSNLINNAVDAFGEKKGEVIVRLDATPEIVAISIHDNGKGMPEHVKEKILQDIAVTEGKEEGHGLGLTQVRETLASNEGKMRIDSQINQGTQITLEFPRIKAPTWIAEEIRVRPNDSIVILDDDKSIHMAWDMRFENILQKYPQMQVHHFEHCHDAVEFIESFAEEEKHKICLLTDFELLKQELNGLHVVEKTKIKRSILVTSHYANDVVLDRSHKLGTKILPKQLTPEILIRVDESAQATTDNQPETPTLKKVDAILVDDDKRFADTLIQYVFGDDEIDYFEEPHEFMKNVKHYPKDTRIYLDNNYKKADVTGFTLAKELYEQGYTKLYLLTGDTLKSDQTPDYIKVIRKDDIDSIKDWN